jgi:hypothetical protein
MVQAECESTSQKYYIYHKLGPSPCRFSRNDAYLIELRLWRFRRRRLQG